MNYLAHAYLSFNQPAILVGNIIADFIKGKKQYEYSLPIQKGIQLHRKIDEFTDFHPATKEAKLFFKPVYGLYAGAFVDIVYDHFLARDTREFSHEMALSAFCTNTYTDLEKYVEVMPLQVQKILPYMRSQNWLYNYQFAKGIEKSFSNLAKKTTYLNDADIAFEVFNEQYDALNKCYDAFFPELKDFTIKQLNIYDNS